jgi:hypothetical protein
VVHIALRRNDFSRECCNSEGYAFLSDANLNGATDMLTGCQLSGRWMAQFAPGTASAVRWTGEFAVLSIPETFGAPVRVTMRMYFASI